MDIDLRRPRSTSSNDPKCISVDIIQSHKKIQEELVEVYERLARIPLRPPPAATYPPVADNRVDDYLRELAKEFNLESKDVDDLRLLRNFEIVILCDDSGSMSTTVDGTSRTRWDELRDIVRIVLLISILFDQNGVDVFFFNRTPQMAVTKPEEIEKQFAEPPFGFSNLAKALEYIFKLNIAKPKRDKKLLVFVATDLEPTNDEDKKDLSAVENIMKDVRDPSTTYVMFLLCNDSKEAEQVLARWDTDMEKVDVLDDFETERQKVIQNQGTNHPFGYGQYILKALLGAVNEKWDSLGEPENDT